MGKISLIKNEEYLNAIEDIIDSAKKRLYCSYFIIDISPKSVIPLLIDNLLIRLSEKAWTGVDVKVIIGGSRNNFQIAKTCISSFRRLQNLRVSCKLLMSGNNTGSHCKYVISDDKVLMGSHNLTFGALSDQNQDSVLITSEDSSEILTGFFIQQWEKINLHES